MKQISFVLNSKPSKDTVVKFVKKDDYPEIPSKAFKGEFLSTSFVYGELTTLYIGLGDEELTALSYKELGATITKALTSEEIYDFSVDTSTLEVDNIVLSNLAQGLALGTYSFSMKSEKKEIPLESIEIVAPKTEDNKSAIEEGLILAESVEFARNMTNLPANHLRPADLAKQIKDLLTPVGIKVEIISGDALKKKGLNGIYLIGDSSEFPPQMVIMRYENGKGKKTALVGKGITFDTGGYSLKGSPHMITMESDMAGSAAVAGAMYALAKNNVEANVVGVVALAENRLSSGSLVPGDVYTSYGGKTIEVLNTDAEGRLVLADAVAYAVKDEDADEVLDIATLTGAVVAALGNGVTGVVANECDIWKELRSASHETGERYMRFPIYKEFEKMLDSDVADIKNIGGSGGGSITGGLFIGRFAEEKPWIHLDIAGTAWVKKPLFAHQTIGATGTGIDTMYYFIKNKQNKEN